MTPSGRGLTPEFYRERLVRQLREEGVPDRVCEAMMGVPRHQFTAQGWDLEQAYANITLPIGFGQTISQPIVVARMTALLLDGAERRSVLEVGTGCGYQTAVLAALCDRVYSVERIGELARSARERLAGLGLLRVYVQHADGFAGWPQQAPFDGIIVTAGADAVPPQLLEQLAIGGRLVMPVGPRGHQVLMTVDRGEGDALRVGRFDPVRFVPLLPETC